MANLNSASNNLNPNSITNSTIEYYSLPPGSIILPSFRCKSDRACPGGLPISATEDACPDGSSGIACAMCTNDRFWNGIICSDCSSFSQSLGLMVGVLFVFLLWVSLWYFACPSHHGRFLVEEVHLRVCGIKLGTSVSLLVGGAQVFWVLSQLGSI